MGLFLGLPVSIYIVAVVFIICLVPGSQNFDWPVHRIGRDQCKSHILQRHQRKEYQIICLYFCGFCAAIAGLILSSYVHSADGNNNGLNYELDAILAVVIGGTLMTGGRFSLFASVVGALIIWTFTITMYTFGVPANALLGWQGGARAGGDPALF